MHDYFIHKLAIGCGQVAKICVCLSPRTHHSIKCKITANKFPTPSTTKRDATASKLTDTQDGTEQQSKEWNGQCMWQIFEWNEIYPGVLVGIPERKYIQWFYCEYLKESDHLCIQIFCKMSLKGILWFYGDRVQPAGDRASSGLWRKEWWTLGFHEMRGMHWVSEEILGSGYRLWYVELFGALDR